MDGRGRWKTEGPRTCSGTKSTELSTETHVVTPAHRRSTQDSLCLVVLRRSTCGSDETVGQYFPPRLKAPIHVGM